MQHSNRVTAYGLKNFKAFHYLEHINLCPLTVLVGANSAGKSSVLQSLLLLKQSLIYGDRSSNALLFDGYYTDLGSFASVVSNFDTTRELEFDFTIDFTISGEQLPDLYPHIEFSDGIRNSNVAAYAYISMSFGATPDSPEATLHDLYVSSCVPTAMEFEQKITLSISGDGRVITSENLPAMPLLPRKRSSELHSVEMDGFLPIRFNIFPQNVRSKKKEKSAFYVPFSYVPALSIPITILANTLSRRIEYVGPLRADPRPFYPVASSPDIGLKGEATVPYLLRHQNDMVRYAPSPVDAICQGTLLEATNYWLQRMKVTPKLTINPVESIAYVAAIASPSTPEKSVNLSQVGFGVSQVLPVLVTGLKGPDDAMLLLEQPEIHLHPRLQAMLAEFLLCVAQAGKTIIVETHSDHLINRLRRCIAEDETGILANMVSILFVHPGTEDNPSSYVEALEIDETGNIVNWPPDFLSEAANESLAILRASQQKISAAKP